MRRADLPDEVTKRLRWPLALSRAALAGEALATAFWPFVTALLVTGALWLSGLWAAFAPGATRAIALTLLLVLVATLALGLKRFRAPTRAAALARLDRDLSGAPLAALADRQATGLDDPGARAIWQAHRAAMLSRLTRLRAAPPRIRLAARDPFALRLIAATGFALALIFGTPAGPGGLVPGGIPTGTLAGASWEGWIEPPSHTGLPVLYLTDIAPGALSVPENSRVTLRFYGTPGAIKVSETLSGDPTPEEPGVSLAFDVARDGEITIDGDTWQVSATSDARPEVMPTGPLTRTLAGDLQQGFRAVDDYGVTSGTARIVLDLAQVARRHGLAPEPEPRPEIVVDLPMPFTGDRRTIEEELVENLAEHPWAGLPVTLTLTATDGAGQAGEAAPLPMVLPARRFLNPMANAIAEQRRDLLWTIDNAARVARLLRAVSAHPDGLFPEPAQYLQLRAIVRGIEADPLPPEARDEAAAALWALAIEIEEGALADALERMRQAQARLSEAMRQGATPEELSELMDELRDATEDYLSQLGDAEGDPEMAPDGDSMTLSQQDLQEMMDRIEELMREGRNDEAQALLDMFQQMMENMRMAQGGGDGQGQSPGEQAMRGLQDTLRQQQGLSDETFRDGQDGAPDGADDLEDRQRALQNEVERQRNTLPGAGSAEGEAARDALDRAGRAMDEAADALEEGDRSRALDRQAEAMEALRDGMRGLDEVMRDQAQGETGGAQGPRDGASPGAGGEASREDPLGRAPGASGRMSTDGPLAEGEDAYRRAEELMEELRRRSGETDRAEQERDYLRRLLDLF